VASNLWRFLSSVEVSQSMPLQAFKMANTPAAEIQLQVTVARRLCKASILPSALRQNMHVQPAAQHPQVRMSPIDMSRTKCRKHVPGACYNGRAGSEPTSQPRSRQDDKLRQAFNKLFPCLADWAMACQICSCPRFSGRAAGKIDAPSQSNFA